MPVEACERRSHFGKRRLRSPNKRILGGLHRFTKVPVRRRGSHPRLERVMIEIDLETSVAVARRLDPARRRAMAMDVNHATGLAVAAR